MDTLIVEAATLQGPAWERTTEYVTDFEGEGFLFDDIGSQAAALDITLPQGQSFYVWVRSLRRAVDDYPGYAGIGERGEPFSMASAVPLNQWVWQRVGPFATTGPSARLTLIRPHPGPATSFIGLFVDTLIVISSATFDPNVNSAWEETFQQSLPVPEGESSGTFDFSNRPGIYRCWVRATDGEKLVDALGNAGLRSNPVEIRIQPAP
jgi:hypothetical protein